MKATEIQWEGNTLKVKMFKSKDELWFHHRGKVFCYKIPTKKRRGGASASSEQDGAVLSPMPGKIMKILVQAGDQVKAGQLLLVMEAMKMEYSIQAPVSGKLESICFAVGDQTKVGDLLLAIAKDEGSN